MIPTSALTKRSYRGLTETEFGKMGKNDTTVVGSTAQVESTIYTNSGLTLFVRKKASMTGFLKAQEGLLALVEGPYPTIPAEAILQSDRLLLVGGGIGITGLIPYLDTHPNVKLLYSVKTADEALVSSLSTVLEQVCEKDISMGRRLNLTSLLRDEAAVGWSRVAVVLCGPAGMCDDVRAIVTRLGRDMASKCRFDLDVDTFLGNLHGERLVAQHVRADVRRRNWLLDM